MTVVHAVGYIPPGRYPNAWMASTPKHPVMERVCRRLPQTARVGEVLQATGPDFLTQVVKENKFKHTRIIKMEDVYVQFWNLRGPHDISNTDPTTQDSV